MNLKKIRFLPDNVMLSVKPGISILAAAAEAGVSMEGPCGGKGTCGKCRVRIMVEEQEHNVLACSTVVKDHLTIEIPQLEVSIFRKSNLTTLERPVIINSGLTKICINVAKPILETQKADIERLLESLPFRPRKIELQVLSSLPEVLRQQQGQVTAVLFGEELIVVEPGDTSEKLYGIAVDIGTTTLVAALVDLLSGETMATASATNTQNIFGADVISRIEHAMLGPFGLEQLTRRVRQVINRLLGKLTQDTGISLKDVYLAVLVGNTTMNHLFLGLDPSQLARAPFIPVTTDLIQMKARDVGLNLLPQIPIYLLPGIASFLGSDTIGAIIATGIDEDKCVSLVVDIGTNGELVLASKGELIACSAAAGPAFEGAQISCGMRAASGAIESLRIVNDLELKVISDQVPKGICGSGLLSAVAEFLRAGIIDESGKMLTLAEAKHLPDALQQRLGYDEKAKYFVLSSQGLDKEKVIISQKDIRELQLAKAAIRAGIQTLLNEAGLAFTDLDKVFLAGAFGNYINKNDALTLGLLPPVILEKIHSAGNAAGAGAKLALLSQEYRSKTDTLAKRIRHIELTARPEFQKLFFDAFNFDGGIGDENYNS